MAEQISVRQILVDGLILSLLLSVVIVASLLFDPYLWLDDYPPDVRARVGEAAETPLALRIGVALVMLGALAVALFRSNRRLLERNDGGVGLGAAFLHNLLVLQVFNLWDVVVLDWLLFMHLLRDRVVLPGTEGMAGYDDYWFHLRASFLQPAPWIGIATMAGIAAYLTVTQPWRRAHGRTLPDRG